MEVAQLYASLKLDSAQYVSGMATARRSIDDAGKSTENVQREMSGLAKTIGTIKNLMVAAFSFEALRRGTSSLIRTANDMEQYRMRLRAVIEDQREADETFQRIKDWAAINPVNTDEAVESFVLLKAAAVDNTEEAIKAVGNLAKVMGRDMQDVAMALVGFNTMQMRRLGILVDQQGSKAVIQIGKLRREVDKDINVMRQNLVEMISISYGRGMEMSKDTFQGIIDTWGGQIANFKTDLAGLNDDSPFRAITKYLNEASEAFDKWMQTPGYKDFIKNFQEITVALLEGAKSVASFSADVVTSDIGSQIIKWGIGLKVAYWGFNSILSVVVKLAKGVVLIQSKIPGMAEAMKSIGFASGWGVAGVGAITAGWGLAALALKDSGKQDISIEKMAQKKREEFAEGEEEFLTKLKKELSPYLKEEGFDIGKTRVAAAEKYAAEVVAARKAAEEEEARVAKESRPLSEKILDPVNEAIQKAMPEFEKASKMVKEFGLDSDKVFNETAEIVKDSMKEILEDVVKTYGPGGIVVMAEKLRQFDQAVPGLAKVANAIEGIKNETKSAKDQISDLNNELNGLTGPIGKVIKAMKQGLFPKETLGEMGRYLEDNLKKAMDTMRKSLALEFPGFSSKALDAMVTSGQREVMEGLGFTRQKGAASNTIGSRRSGEVTVGLSEKAIQALTATKDKSQNQAQSVNVTVNQYGFQVKNEIEARSMGRKTADGVKLALAGAQ